ncbi:MAG: transporter substrate-binding domain-containing protein [Colwelliaceae bacterium]|nr:transporter substrate-binding domain-containing protein [Colwelliaceae bacterium]
MNHSFIALLTQHFLFLIFSTYSYSALATTDICEAPLKLSSTSDWYPYLYQDEDNRSTGVDVELLTIILNRMGCQLEVVHFPERRWLLELKRGGFDIGLGVSKTTSRLNEFLYSKAYRNEKNKFAYRMSDVDINPAINLQEILKLNKIIAINAAGWYGDEIQKAKLNYKHFNYGAKTVNRLILLNYGRVDIVVEDEIVLCSDILRNEFKKIRVHPTVLFEAPIHFIFSRKSVSLEFVDMFNNILDKMRYDGSLLSHYNEHLPKKCNKEFDNKNKQQEL